MYPNTQRQFYLLCIRVIHKAPTQKKKKTKANEYTIFIHLTIYLHRNLIILFIIQIYKGKFLEQNNYKKKIVNNKIHNFNGKN